MSFLTIFAVICAYIIKGMCGFANTLVFTSIVAFQQNNINISPVELFVGYPSNMIIAWKERKNLSPKIFVPLSILVILGAIPGTIFLKVGNAQNIKILFGIIVIIVGIDMYITQKYNKKQSKNPLFLAFIGLISGVLCGLFGVSALLASYVGRTTNDTSSFKANLCMVFFVENTFRTILYLMAGIITLDVLKNAAMLIPFMIIGLFTGMTLSKKINEKAAKKFIVIMLIISGAALILTNL